MNISDTPAAGKQLIPDASDAGGACIAHGCAAAAA